MNIRERGQAANLQNDKIGIRPKECKLVRAKCLQWALQTEHPLLTALMARKFIRKLFKENKIWVTQKIIYIFFKQKQKVPRYVIKMAGTLSENEKKENCRFVQCIF
jgi:hypothetical protein